MGSLYQKISIRIRFNLLIAGVMVVFTAVTVYFITSIGRVQMYHEYRQNIAQLEIEYLNLRKFEQNFLLRFQEDQAFFTTKENRYIDKHKQASNAFIEVQTKLSEHTIASDLHLEESFGKIATYEKRYDEIFEKLYTELHRRGANGSGSVGEMMVAANMAYTSANSQYLKEYNVKLMQISEKYLQNKDAEQYRNFLATFSQLNRFISSGLDPMYRFAESESIDTSKVDTMQISVNESVTRDYVKHVNNYKYHFSSVFKIDTEVGLSYKDGLQGELRAEIHKIDPELENVKMKIAEQLKNFTGRTMNSAYVFFALLLVGLILFIRQFSNSILRPVNQLKSYISPLSRGSLPDKLPDVDGQDEISEMTTYVNELISGLKQTTNFAADIGRGQFDTDYKPLSSDDVLGNSLIEMRQNLNQAKIDEEMRKREDDMRKWANEGLAKFNDILRQSSGNIQELSAIVIRELVHFLKANQGGVFVQNKDDKEIVLDLVAAYAYGQDKKRIKRIALGEGLVGTAAVEKETIYMTDIPENYITITSGLGGSKPRSLLIVPMKVEDEIFGIIEIASFNEFNSNEVEFAEKVSENIAASLSITRINSRTSELLEQSQRAAEQMAIQEEEMRRSFEELKQTQEESAKREAEMSSILTAINSSSLVIEINTKGYITAVNKELLDILKLDERDIVGKMHHDFVSSENEKSYSDFWYKLKNGDHQKSTERIRIGGREKWFGVTYTPIKDETGEVQKILSLATDLTETKELEFELREQAEAMQAQEEEMRQNLEELHSTQEEMAKKQEMLEKANVEAKAREQILKEAVNKANDQERELQLKIGELNSIKNQLEEEHDRMIELNSEIASQERETTVVFKSVDKNNMVAEFETDGTLISVNDLFLHRFGYTYRDVKNKHHRMFITEEDRKRPEYKQLWNNLRQGIPFENECKRVTKSGVVLFFKGIFTPIKNIHGQTYKILEILSDVTELKRTAAEHEGRMANINRTNVMVEIGKNQAIVSANTLFAESVGYSVETLLTMNYRDIISKEIMDTERYEHFWRDLKRGNITGGTWHFLSKEGTKLFFKGTFTPLRDPVGQIEKIMFMGLDVTDYVNQSLRLKELEEQIKATKNQNIDNEDSSEIKS